MFNIELYYDDLDSESLIDNIKFDRSETFFNKAKNSFLDILNIKKFLENRMVSGLDKSIGKIKNNLENYNKLDWSNFINEEVPVSVGFDTNLYMLSDFLNDNILENFNKYKIFYNKIDIELNKFIGDKEHRLQKLTFADNSKLDKDIKELSLLFNKLLNFKTHELHVATIKDLVINKDGYGDTVNTTYNILTSINENEYQTFVEMNRKLDMKLKVVYELIHTEEVVYSKEIIKALSSNITTLASYSTLIGKMILANYETSFILLNIEKVIKHYE